MADKIVKITGDQTVGGVSRLLDPTDKSLDMVLFQQGKPVLDSELNLAQNVQSQRHAQLIRDTHPSGFVNISEMENNPSNLTQWRTKEEMVAYVNGYRVVIPAGTVMPVSAAPTTGTREDLIFLEVWLEELAPTANPENTLSTVKQHGNVDGTTLTNDLVDTNVNDESSRRVQVRYRIRNQENVDFASHPFGLRAMNRGWDNVPLGQGGSPSIPEGSSGFTQAGGAVDTVNASRNMNRVDMGLWYAGGGTTNAASLFNSVDGYTYAIPMFRLRRRNTGDFSVQNPNGSRAWSTASKAYNLKTGAGLLPLETMTIVLDPVDASRVRVGDILGASPFYVLEVMAVSGNSVTMKSIGTAGVVTYGEHRPLLPSYLGKYSPGMAPDGVFNNVVAAQDVTDLRRVTDIRDVDFKTLMDRATHDFFRRDVFSKRLVKQYHGVPKTPIDANHIFYASYDGTVEPELNPLGVLYPSLGNDAEPRINALVPHVAGLGAARYNLFTNSYTSYRLDKSVMPSSGVYTIDFWITQLDDRPGKHAIQFGWGSQYANSCVFAPILTVGKPTHIRIVWKGRAVNQYDAYCDGKLVGTYAVSTAVGSSQGHIDLTDDNYFHLTIGTNRNNPASHTLGRIIFSDLSISNIDRGATFATLPEDVKQGRAQVTHKFTEDRKAYSAAILSEAKTVYVNPASPNVLPHVQATQATAGVWAQNDTIKLKATGNNILTGLQDGDTAGVMIMDVITGAGATSAVFETDSVTGIVVGDVLRIGPWETSTPSTVTVTAVDATKNWVTVSNTVAFPSDVTTYNGKRLTEFTTSSSAIAVSRWDGTNWVAVTTTQAGLGYTEVTLTLPAGIPADAQLKIDYTDVRYPDRDKAGLPEDVVALEVNGVIGNGEKVETQLNFVGKVEASNVVNPHIAKAVGNATGLYTPASFTFELAQSNYATISSLDASPYLVTASAVDKQPQQLFSFNLIAHVERTYGTIPGVSTSEKVAWLKANVARMNFDWYGYGTSHAGYKASITPYSNSAYASPQMHTASAITKRSYPLTAGGITTTIQPDGFLHFIAYAEPSNGTTPSIISTDYVELQVELKANVVPDPVRGLRVLHTKGNYLEFSRETNTFRLGFTPKPTDVIASYALMRRETFRELTTPTVTVLAEADSVLVTDLVSAVGSKQGTHPWKNIADLVERDTVNAVGELGYGELPITADVKGGNVGHNIQVHSLALVGGFTGQKTVRTPYQKKLISLMRYLVLHDGELKLMVVSDTVWGGTVDLAYGYSFLIPLMERRVMHPGMAVGTRSRSTIYPKAWLDAPKFLNQK